MIVVADASPLIYLSALGRLELLRALYVRVLVPRTVFDEVVVVGQGEMGSGEVAAATWIEVREVADRDGLLAKFEARIDAGEATAIVLALNVHADLIVMDDRLGRREAEAKGLVVHGTLGVLVAARRGGLLSNLRQELERLQTLGFRVSQRAIADALALAGE